MRWVKAKERTLHYQEQCISNSLVFHQLPNIGPKQLFALALLECTYKVGTSQSSSKPTSSHFIRRKRIYLAKVSKTLPCKFNKFPNMHFNNMKLVSYMVVVKRYIRNIFIEPISFSKLASRFLILVSKSTFKRSIIFSVARGKNKKYLFTRTLKLWKQDKRRLCGLSGSKGAAEQWLSSGWAAAEQWLSSDWAMDE